MSPITKFEATGIFLSVAIMAVALAYLRFTTTPTNPVVALDGATQSAAIVVSDSSAEDADGLESALRDSSTLEGELVKLVIDDVKMGTGDKVVKSGDTVVVHYVGRTRDGVQFDSSYVRGQPFEFTVGGGRVIKGWEKGLLGMKVEGQRILVIPPDMAYGNRQVGPIPPNTPLVFAVELLEIK